MAEAGRNQVAACDVQGQQGEQDQAEEPRRSDCDQKMALEECNA